jgi:hypothetical protein
VEHGCSYGGYRGYTRVAIARADGFEVFTFLREFQMGSLPKSVIALAMTYRVPRMTGDHEDSDRCVSNGRLRMRPTSRRLVCVNRQGELKRGTVG